MAWWADLLAGVVGKREISMRKLGDEAGVATSTVSRLLSGKMRPQSNTIESLGQVLHHSPREIEGWLFLQDDPGPDDGREISYQLANLRGAIIGYIAYTLWRAREYWPSDRLQEMAGSGILGKDPFIVYEELGLRSANYTMDQIDEIVLACARLIRLMDQLKTRPKGQDTKENFHREMLQFQSLLTDDTIVEYARHVRVYGEVNDIKEDLWAIDQIFDNIKTKLDRLPTGVFHPMREKDD